jgi:titin
MSLFVRRFRRPALEVLEDRLLLTAYTVNTTKDLLGDKALLPGNVPEVTLRDVLTAINTQAASGNAPAGSLTNTVSFAIGATGTVQTINLTSALPALKHQALLDGWSQGGLGYAGTPLIVLNEAAVARSASGLKLAAGSDNSTVRGLSLQQFGGAGIELSGTTGNLIVGNTIGTTAAGTARVGGNTGGVLLDLGAVGNTVGGAGGFANVISANGPCVEIKDAGTTGNTVLGNMIGVNRSGSAYIGALAGVEIRAGAAANTVGGTAAGSANVIVANGPGVEIKDAGTTGNAVLGNMIGTDRNGTTYLGTLAGVEIRSQASGNTVGGTAAGAGNVIDATGPAVEIKDAGTSGNAVLGNMLGTNRSGGAYLRALVGVEIRAGATGNTVGSGNVMVVNGPGVEIMDAGTSNNVVLGNRIGTNSSGSAYLGALAGVEIRAGATSNTVGGTAPGSANVIAANGPGVEIMDAGTTGNTVLGNLIGTNSSGTARLGTLAGVEIRGGTTGNTIGGAAPGSANVISGSLGPGVEIKDAGTTGNTVLGNLIGTDRTGTVKLGNVVGVEVRAGASGNTVGGTVAGSANVISGNGLGVEIMDAGTTGNVVLGNRIGTDISGTAPLGNTGDGVLLRYEGATANTIGGTAAGSGNAIAFNAKGVVLIDAATVGDSILGNSIWGNAGPGIDLGNDGPTPNGVNPRAFPNHGQNTPILTGRSPGSVSGTLTSVPGTTFRLEFYATPAGGPANQGQVFLGFLVVTTKPSGSVTFTAPIATIPVGSVVTATATNLATGDTSEFSPPG